MSELKEFLPFQESKKLKELGFDYPCYTWFDKQGNIDYEISTKFGVNYNLPKYDLISAPLYRQAFRFFREKYGLYVSINIHPDNMWSVIIKSTTSNDTHSSGYIVDLINEGYSTFKTYEEAEITCLQKLIEIC